jgi:hypothetical protein
MAIATIVVIQGRMSMTALSNNGRLAGTRLINTPVASILDRSLSGQQLCYTINFGRRQRQPLSSAGMLPFFYRLKNHPHTCSYAHYTQQQAYTRQHCHSDETDTKVCRIADISLVTYNFTSAQLRQRQDHCKQTA